MQDKNTYSNPSLVVLLAVVLAIGAAAITSWALRAKGGQVQSATASDLESIIKRGTIRCGYVSNPHHALSIRIPRKSAVLWLMPSRPSPKPPDFKVEWTEEVGFGSMVEGLRANRYDMVPCAIWPTADARAGSGFQQAAFLQRSQRICETE